MAANGGKGVALADLPPGLREALAPYDFDGDGILQPAEVARFHARWHELHAAEERRGERVFSVAASPALEDKLKELDVDGDGSIDRTELARAVDLLLQSRSRVKYLT